MTTPGTVPAAAPTKGGKGDLLTRVSVGRVSEMIVDQIRLLIRQGDLAPGDRLPAERELCERFGVSRVTVREALRVLEANGLVAIRVGARGGAFVSAPSSRLVGEGISDLITLSSMSAQEVTESRMVLELGIMPLVCERATEEDIAALYEICDRSKATLDDDEYPLALSAEWHTRYARATHNGAIAMLVESLHDPLIMSLERAREAAPLHGRRGVREHRALVDAIAERDAARASELMRTHLERTAKLVTTAERGRTRRARSSDGRKRAGTATEKPTGTTRTRKGRATGTSG